MVKMLLDAGTEVGARDNMLNSVLHEAIGGREPSEQVLSLLLMRDVKVSKRS